MDEIRHRPATYNIPIEPVSTLGPALLKLDTHYPAPPFAQTPELLTKPLHLMDEGRKTVFTHHIGGNVFGDEVSLLEYQKIMHTIEEEWPALSKLVDAQKVHNRVAIFTTRSGELLKQEGLGGFWADFYSEAPEFKRFKTHIMVNVDLGRPSINGVGHEWFHEIQSSNHALKLGNNPNEVPWDLNVYLKHADEEEVIACWLKGYEKYQKTSMPSTDPRHMIYGGPSRHYAQYRHAVQAGQLADTVAAHRKEFLHEVGSYLVSTGTTHGPHAIQEHAKEQGQVIDKTLGIKLFNASSRIKFVKQLGSCVTQNLGQICATIGFGFDVYHEYHQLPETTEYRKTHALVNGAARYVVSSALFHTPFNVGLALDTSHLGSAQEAAQHIEKTVGKDRLDEILRKGYETYLVEWQPSGECDYLPSDMLTPEERKIFLQYKNCTTVRPLQESMQEGIGWVYKAVKETITDFFHRHSPDLEEVPKVLEALGTEVRGQLGNRNLLELLGDAKQQEQLATTIRARGDEILATVPKRRPSLPPEQMVAALPPAQPDAPAAEIHFAYPISEEEEPAVEHPLVTDLKEVLKETEELSAKLDRATQEGQLVDESTLKRIAELTDDCERAANHLQKRWDDLPEYQTTALQCVGVIANQIYHKLQQSREEKAFNRRLEAEKEAFDHQKGQLRRTAQPKITYVEVENFVYDQYHPQGFLTQTILEVRRDTRAQLDRLRELQGRRSTREAALESTEKLFDSMDRNDRAIQRMIQENLQRQQRTTRGLQRLTNLFATAAGIMSIFPCPPAYVAVATTAGAISQVGQAAVGKKGDRQAAKLHEAQTKSLRMHQDLAETAQTRQHELGIIGGQIEQCYQVLLNQNSLHNTKGLRDTLESLIDDRQHQIEELTDTLHKEEKALENANQAVKTADKAVAHTEKQYRKHHKDSVKERLHKNKRAQNFCKTKQARHQGDVNTAKDLLADLEEQNAEDRLRLSRTLFLAPMTEQIESVIFEEERRLDFDRHLVDDEINQIKAGDLTQRGLAQQQMCINFAQYNRARMAERHLMLYGIQAAKGLTQELSNLTGSHKLTLGVDIGEQLYRVYNLQKHFEECAVPQFQKFVKVLQLDDGRGFADKVKELSIGELVTGFAIPGLQMVTASLAVLRLCQAIMNTESLSPEQQFIVHVVEHAFQEHQHILNKQFDELKEHLDHHHAELTDELKQLRSDIGCIGEELYKAIERTKGEIQEQLHSQEFQSYKFEVDKIANDWLERDRIFWDQFTTVPEQKKERKVLEYLATLEAALPTCMAAHLNGLTSSGQRGWKPRFPLDCLAEGPQYATEILAQQLGLSEPQPNLHLFRTLSDCLDKLGKSCGFASVRQRLDRLHPQLESVRASVRQLSNQRRRALESAHLAREQYVQEILSLTARMHHVGLAVQKALVQTQIAALLPAHELAWQGAKRIGERKFFVSDLVHRTPIHSGYTRHGMTRDLIGDAKHLHEWAWSSRRPDPIGYAGFLTVVGLGLAYVTSIDYLDPSDERSLTRGRIQQILSHPVRDIMETDKPPSIHHGFHFEIETEYSNEHQRYQVTAEKLTRMFAGWRGYSAYGQHERANNVRPLIAFTIQGGDGEEFGYTLGFLRNSLIQSEDIRRIPAPPDTIEYAAQSRRMLSRYFGYLFFAQDGTAMVADNPFRALANESHFIHSSTGEFLPLALPQAFLQAMEQTVLADQFELMVSETGSLIPSFNFRKEASGDQYEFLIDYKVVQAATSKVEEFGSFQVATFDRAVVESFRQVSFHQQGGRYDYTLGEINLQEFLLQAFYGNLFGLGLPGKGTTRLQNAELFIPQEVPFVGLHQLLARHPNRAVHYKVDFAGDSPAELLGNRPIEWRGRQSFRFWLDAQEGKRKSKSLEQTANTYAQKYHLARALCGLFSNVDSQSIDELFLRRGLFSPSHPEIARAHALLQRLQEHTIT